MIFSSCVAVDTNQNDTGENEENGLENEIIKTADELAWALENGESDKNYTVKAETLDLSGLSFGGLENYSGTFDFGGCVVSGATSPMFLSVHGGTVKNLVLENCSYEFTTEMAKKKLFLIDEETNEYAYAPVVCMATNVTVSNVCIRPSVVINVNMFHGNESYVGGVIGHAQGSQILIENCDFRGELSVSARMVYVGAIAGGVITSNNPVDQYEKIDNFKVLIQNCVNQGKMTGIKSSNGIMAAGIVAKMRGTAIHHCANYGDICNNSGNIGGIVTYIAEDASQNNHISECINTGRLYHEGTPMLGDLELFPCIGGIVAAHSENNLWLENCVNTGEIADRSLDDSRAGIVAFGTEYDGEIMKNCFNLATACKLFSKIKSYMGETDPTTQLPDATNCANCNSIDEIFEKLSTACPDVFVRDGDNIKLAQLS